MPLSFFHAKVFADVFRFTSFWFLVLLLEVISLTKKYILLCLYIKEDRVGWMYMSVRCLQEAAPSDKY